MFKIERGAAGERIAFARLFSGTVRTRERVRLRGGDGEGKLTAIEVFDGGGLVGRSAVSAGRIAKLWGLGDVRIGDALGHPHPVAGHAFAPPTLETVVIAARAADRGALHVPLIGFR